MIKRAKVIAIANQKGGVGKTTTAQALSEGLTEKGFRVLGVDLDSQGNLSLITGHDSNRKKVSDLFKGSAIEETIEKDFIASDERTITEIDRGAVKVDFLKKTFSGLRDYDYIIIDTPPSLDTLTLSAFVSADEVIITTTADLLSTAGIVNLLKSIEASKRLNRDLYPLGLLFVRYNPRSVIQSQFREQMKAISGDYGLPVFETTVRESSKIKEAQALREPLFKYSPKATTTTDYRQFVEEVLTLEKLHDEKKGK